MSRKCELTGKSVLSGNNVSHANNKTKRWFLPNILNASFSSSILDKRIRIKACAKAIKSVEKAGGIDEFLMKAKNLGDKAKKIKKIIMSKQPK